ncbi:superoxide dismutase family protein [Gloeobacter kilaueensis]|uniref:Superoxide dismutase n=1 Tax=Gloeobacter kilaueensis (strain ATCC BAA-2537 / CCAP 1431/1 / ULC 316 / JS1) TaxID=1183438 RepID=U5QPK5_GLOK1|nr:superoxide dismutase family protein [Gloeobacter kilaueensis]AGY59625.1 superoxide dismutase [Gloeobacter kilaueensis JS1]
MKKIFLSPALIALLLAAPVLAGNPPQATAQIKDAKGEPVGTASFVQQPKGVLVTVEVKGLEPGKHPMHIHAVGKCDAPDFRSAGPHLGDHKMAGMKGSMAMETMAGDLPELLVGADGTGKAEVLNPEISLGSKSLLQKQGTALLIHDATKPSKRIACGVISTNPNP